MLPLSPALLISAATALLRSDKLVAMRKLADYDPQVEFSPRRRDNHGSRDPVATAAFIGHIGYWSHREKPGHSDWPFPLDADCDELARLAEDRGVLSLSAPDPGEILLRWSFREQRYTRASIVLDVDDMPVPRVGWSYTCIVLEGSATGRRLNSNRAVPDGHVQSVRKVSRCCCPALGDRFISWVDLDARGDSARAA